MGAANAELSGDNPDEMKIFRHWAKAGVDARSPTGRPARVECWRGSHSSQLDAERLARARAQQIAEAWLENGRIDEYSYALRGIREEIIEDIYHASHRIGVVTRNAYGALVLNAAHAMFIDIDFPRPRIKPGCLRGLLELFVSFPPYDPEPAALHRIRKAHKLDRDLAMRVYRTHSGFRVFITNRTYDPNSEQSHKLLERFGSDPLYRRLCSAQECYRARLTPKAWRIGLEPPSRRWPHEAQEDEAALRAWQRRYESACSGFVTCQLIEKLGPREVSPQIAPILALHDEIATTSLEAELA